MTRDVAAQAVHDRLEHLAAAMPHPDPDAGWAALAAQLEPPVATVIPLRRSRHRRTVVVGVAAAMLVASGAVAMVRHGGHEAQGTSERPGVAAPSFLRGGPHVHRPFVGPPAVHGPGPSHPVSDHHDGETTTGNHPLSPGSSGETSSGSTHHGNTHSFHHDAADDTDHGTGNDGSHDDNGQGNDANGQDSQGQDSQGNGGGSSVGSGNDQGPGNDQGSAGGQASGPGTHAGAGDPASGAGDPGQGQGGGHGPDA